MIFKGIIIGTKIPVLKKPKNTNQKVNFKKMAKVPMW